MVRHKAGFSLIELLVVLTMVAALLSLVAPRYMQQTDRAKEVVLKENLAGLRHAIDQFYADKGEYPQSLEALVTEGYVRKIPMDPITSQHSSWVIVHPDNDASLGVKDVRSGAGGAGLDGSSYASW